MLGYALALLYVARHGLREQELWALLWELKHQDEENHNRMSQEEEAEMGLLKLIIDHRLKLLTIFRNMDSNHDGTLSVQEFRRSIRRLNLGINDLQIERMVNHLVVQPGVDVEAGTDAEGNVMSADEKEMATAAAAAVAD